MKRPVFFSLLLSFACATTPLAVAAMSTDGEAPSLLSRIGIPAWPSAPVEKPRDLSLPIWAVLGASMLDLSATDPSAQPRAKAPKRLAVSGEPRRVKPAPKFLQAKPHVQLAHRKLAAASGQEIFFGALY